MGLGIRPVNGSERLAVSPEVFTDSLGSVCPVLMEYLTSTKWDDGKARVPSTLSVFFEDGMFKVWLNDKDLHRGACIGGATLLQAMSTLDRKLESGELDWRPDRRPGRR